MKRANEGDDKHLITKKTAVYTVSDRVTEPWSAHDS